MNEDLKLEKIRKSCKTGKIITTILLIAAIVGFMVALILGISILNMGPQFDKAVKDSGGSLEAGAYSYSLVNVDVSDFSGVSSDNPAIQARIDESPMSVAFGVYLLVIALLVGLIALVLGAVLATFKKVEKAETPFCKPVKKQVVITLIIAAVAIGATIGVGFGLVVGIVTWLVSAIMDYGISLQQQYDETL